MGVDQSLAGTGVALVDYDTGDAVLVTQISTPAKWALVDRLLTIQAFIAKIRDQYDPLDVWIEQPISFRSGTGTLNLGALKGVILIDNPAINEVNISTVKKHATGNGAAKKEAMIEAAMTRWPPPSFKPYTDNMADALWIADYGRKISLATFTEPEPSAFNEHA